MGCFWPMTQQVSESCGRGVLGVDLPVVVVMTTECNMEYVDWLGGEINSVSEENSDMEVSSSL